MQKLAGWGPERRPTLRPSRRRGPRWLIRFFVRFFMMPRLPGRDCCLELLRCNQTHDLPPLTRRPPLARLRTLSKPNTLEVTTRVQHVFKCRHGNTFAAIDRLDKWIEWPSNPVPPAIRKRTATSNPLDSVSPPASTSARLPYGFRVFRSSR